MAKRKRLSPALISGSEQALSSQTEPYRDRPPIARVAAEAADRAAFEDVSRALTEAREEGRLIVKLPLEAIETGHLVRDRIAFDDEEMAALKTSLEARGQQVPIEVVPLEAEGRYGLISGLRRVMALGQIGATEVLALVRQPESSSEAYLAMVEENEIRAGVSFYERARLAFEAARLGLYDTPQAAIAHLFSGASPAKRSKIGSFVTVHRALGKGLRFPAAIPERVGLALAKALAESHGFADRLLVQLDQAEPTTPEAERRLIEAALSQGQGATKPTKPAPQEIRPGLFAEPGRGRLTLSGPALTEDLKQALIGWLETQMNGNPK